MMISKRQLSMIIAVFVLLLPSLCVASPPIADAGPNQVVFGEVTLNGSDSSDPDGTIESYEWQLLHTGNPTYDRAAQGVNPTVSDLEPGFYDVVLTVTDDQLEEDTAEMVLAAAGVCEAGPCGPVISILNPSEGEPKSIVRINGVGFGDVQGSSIVNIGLKAFGSSSPRITLWSDTKIRFKIPVYKSQWFGTRDSKRKRIWVTVDGVESNREAFDVIADEFATPVGVCDNCHTGQHDMSACSQCHASLHSVHIGSVPCQHCHQF